MNGFERQLAEVTSSVEKNIKDRDQKQLINLHLAEITDRIRLLKRRPQRRERSINWIGSAWKWVAGNPDAADWDKVLESQQGIVENNNHQYKINEKLFGAIEDMTAKINWVIDKSNDNIGVADIQRFRQDILDQILLIKEKVNEMVRACQMAKSGIINTNLLDHDEINMLVNELETLPYENGIEAIEFGVPSIYTNESTLLYVLSMPKVRKEDYNLLLLKPSIIEGKQVNIEFDRVLINQEETYGVNKNCLSINNSTVCKEEALTKIPEDHCMVRLLKGGHAACTHRVNTNEVIELIKEDTIFVTNFNGQLTSKNSTQTLMGTFIIRMNNEAVQLKNRTFTSSSVTTLQVLPPVMANVTTQGHKIDLQFVHSLSLKNIERLGNLTNRMKISSISDIIIFILLISLACILWRKISGKLGLPTIGLPKDTPPITTY